MKTITRPAASRLGVSTTMPAETYEHRTKPLRNRVKGKAIKPASTKPRAHRVGRTKK